MGNFEKYANSKKLSHTRWSARADSVKAVVSRYENFKDALNKIYEDNFQKLATKVEAQGLLNEFNSLETAIMIAFWSEILETIDKTNISLQKVDTTIECIVTLYASLEKFVQSKRNIDSFNLYKSEGIKLSGCDEYKRIRKRKRQFDENTSEEVQFDANDEFRINTYYAIIDKILAEVQKRKCAYDNIYSTFGFLVNLKNINEDIIRNNAAKLCEIYQTDLENNFIEECLHFKHVNLLENTENISTAELSLKTIIELKIESTFPNVTTALRIFLSIATTNCSGERSFSAIKRIKNYLRSSLGQSKLNDLSILSIERDLFDNLNTSDIIDQFAREKARKINI